MGSALRVSEQRVCSEGQSTPWKGHLLGRLSCAWLGYSAPFYLEMQGVGSPAGGKGISVPNWHMPSTVPGTHQAFQVVRVMYSVVFSLGQGLLF